MGTGAIYRATYWAYLSWVEPLTAAVASHAVANSSTVSSGDSTTRRPLPAWTLSSARKASASRFNSNRSGRLTGGPPPGRGWRIRYPEGDGSTEPQVLDRDRRFLGACFSCMCLA